MSIREIFERNVVTVNRDVSILQAARAMREQHVGSLVVVEESNGERRPVGILTDRDLVVEIMALEVDPKTVNVADVMSFELVVANETDELGDTVEMMRASGVRRMPVVDEYGGLVGIIALDDVIQGITGQLGDVVGLMLTERGKEIRRRH